jgi:hypothetical protein
LRPALGQTLDAELPHLPDDAPDRGRKKGPAGGKRGPGGKRGQCLIIDNRAITRGRQGDGSESENGVWRCLLPRHQPR